MSYHVLHNTLSGLGNGTSCANVPWKNQMGGTGTGTICAVDDKYQICGSTIAFQQALSDLGFPCAVTGAWTGTEGKPLNDWRASRGFAKDYTKGPSAAECGMLADQWNALKGAAPEAEPPSGGTVSPIARRRIAASSLLTRVSQARTIKPAGTSTKPATDEPAPVDEAAPTQDVSLSVGFDFAGWWGRMSTLQKGAVVGGGVLVVGGAAYLLLK